MEPESPAPRQATLANPVLRFRCSGCNSLIEIDQQDAGKKARCPKCQTVQRAAASPAPAPAGPPPIPASRRGT
jgi:phage FluMu protein Com